MMTDAPSFPLRAAGAIPHTPELDDRWLTVPEVVERYKLSSYAVRKYVHQGTLVAHMSGGNKTFIRRVSEKSVRALLATDAMRGLQETTKRPPVVHTTQNRFYQDDGTSEFLTLTQLCYLLSGRERPNSKEAAQFCADYGVTSMKVGQMVLFRRSELTEPLARYRADQQRLEEGKRADTESVPETRAPIQKVVLSDASVLALSDLLDKQANTITETLLATDTNLRRALGEKIDLLIERIDALLLVQEKNVALLSDMSSAWK